jgi:hypothetical protein
VLKDLEEGLQYFGLLCQIKKHPDLFKQVAVTAENILDNLMVMYSQQQLLKNMDDDIFKYFTDFILALYRVYKKKLNRFEIALSFGKQLLVSSFLCI